MNDAGYALHPQVRRFSPTTLADAYHHLSLTREQGKLADATVERLRTELVANTTAA